MDGRYGVIGTREATERQLAPRLRSPLIGGGLQLSSR